jgi:HlyD family secretion protein
VESARWVQSLMASVAIRGLRTLLTLMVLGFCWACSNEPKETEQPVPVQIVPVSKATLQQTVLANAVLFPIAQSALVPKISAPVKKFYVNRGSHVRAGQLLAELENRDLAAAAQENKGTFDQAQATYATATAADIPQELQKAQLDAQAAMQAFNAAQKIYDSRKELFEQGALPRKELDQAGVELTNARNQYEIAEKRLQSLRAIGAQQAQKSAKGQLESAEGKYQGAQAQLSYSQIRSPIDGVVADRPLYPGEMAAAGTPLLTVMEISQVVARAHIPQQSAALLQVGDPAEVTVPGFNNAFPGKVTVVSPALDPGSTTVEVWVTLKNPGERLKPGTSVQFSALARSIQNALVVPAAALLTAQDGTTSVMLAGNDGRAHQVKVKTGVRSDDQIQIVDGLHAGDRVVASGSYGLPDNRKITEAKAEQSENDKKD